MTVVAKGNSTIHFGTMVFVQLAHALSLNDVCDWLRLKARAI
jgi:hypothetical protein